MWMEDRSQKISSKLQRNLRFQIPKSQLDLEGGACQFLRHNSHSEGAKATEESRNLVPCTLLEILPVALAPIRMTSRKCHAHFGRSRPVRACFLSFGASAMPRRDGLPRPVVIEHHLAYPDRIDPAPCVSLSDRPKIKSLGFERLTLHRQWGKRIN